MADNNGGGGHTFLGFIVGALLIAVVGIGAFVFMNGGGGGGTEVKVELPQPSGG